MKKIRIKAPAKINLSLKVEKKRPDGFHPIESVMAAINLFDYIDIEVKEKDADSSMPTLYSGVKINISSNSNEIPNDSSNIAHKAAELFFEACPKILEKAVEINIYIEKNIPVSAGLAGGSTDAAGTLFGLNEILGHPLSQEELHKLCSQLGSDLNFCLEGGRQMTKGRGEILEPLEFEEFNVSLIKPENLGISAKEAYTKFSGKNGKSDFKNDLEWAVIDDYKELQTIKKLYSNSMMSGSGSTYFVINDEFKSLDGYQVFNNLKAIPYGICIKKDLH